MIIGNDASMSELAETIKDYLTKAEITQQQHPTGHIKSYEITTGGSSIPYTLSFHIKNDESFPSNIGGSKYKDLLYWSVFIFSCIGIIASIKFVLHYLVN